MAPFVNLTHPIHTNIFEPAPGLKFLSQLIDDPWYSQHIQKKFHHKDVLTTPDFDVRETASAYFLEANFAGIGNTSDIKMEWVGGRTLVIDAHVPKLDLKETWGVDVYPEVEEQKGTHSPVGAQQLQQEPSAPQDQRQRSDTDTQQQGGQHHNGDEVKVHGQENERKHEEHSMVRDWLAERHIGNMQRSFTFPREVAVESVKARLRNGLLMIMIPKIQKTETRSKIVIED